MPVVKPTGAVAINPAGVANDALVFCMPLIDPLNAVDLVTGNLLAWYTPAGAIAAEVDGELCLTPSVLAGGYTIPNDLALTGAHTIIVRYQAAGTNKYLSDGRAHTAGSYTYHVNGQINLGGKYVSIYEPGGLITAAFSTDGTTTKSYEDGIPRDVGLLVTQDIRAGFVIGSRYTHGNNIDTLSSFQIYNRQLTDAEILQLADPFSNTLVSIEPSVVESETVPFATNFDAAPWPYSHTLSAIPSRKLLLWPHREKDSPARSVIDLAVDGVSATKVIKVSTSGDEFREDTDFWYFDVPAGWSGDVDIDATLDGASNNDFILRCVEVVNAKPGAPFAVDTVSTNTANMNFSLADCPANSVIVSSAVCNGAYQSGAAAWSFGVGNPDGFSYLSEVCSLGSFSGGVSGCNSVGGYKSITSISTESFAMVADGTAEYKTGVAVCIEGFVGGGPTTIPAALATETDSAFAVGISKHFSLGLATASNTAGAITPVKRLPIGLAQESDTAQPVTSFKALSVGLAAETDSAFTVDISKLLNIGLAQSSDTAFGLNLQKILSVGLATEADTALSVVDGSATVVSVGLAVSTETAWPVSISKAFSLGLAAEADSALPVTFDSTTYVPIGLATEASSAFSVGISKAFSVGLALESDSALPVTIDSTVYIPVGLASELDTGFPFSIEKRVSVGLAVEVDYAMSFAMGGWTYQHIGLPLLSSRFSTGLRVRRISTALMFNKL